MAFATILWDNDGVLVDTEVLYFDATRDAMAEVGFELTEALFREHFLRASTGACRRVATPWPCAGAAASASSAPWTCGPASARKSP